MSLNAPLIVNSVNELGFKIRDVTVLLNSHAHFDHSRGLAELKQLTGAKLIASKVDTQAKTSFKKLIEYSKTGFEKSLIDQKKKLQAGKSK